MGSLLKAVRYILFRLLPWWRETPTSTELSVNQDLKGTRVLKREQRGKKKRAMGSEK